MKFILALVALVSLVCGAAATLDSGSATAVISGVTGEIRYRWSLVEYASVQLSAASPQCKLALHCLSC